MNFGEVCYLVSKERLQPFQFIIVEWTYKFIFHFNRAHVSFDKERATVYNEISSQSGCTDFVRFIYVITLGQARAEFKSAVFVIRKTKI